VGLNVLL